LILDVGCGSHPRGDVNIDLYTGISPHHRNPIQPRIIPNFILADAQHLPIRSATFKLALCSHVLEHLSEPLKAIRELAQAAEIIHITVPNNPVLQEHPEHLYTWTLTSLRNLLRRHFNRVEVTADTALGDVQRSRLFKICRRLPVIGKPLLRVLSRVTALELRAICMEAKTGIFKRPPESVLIPSIPLSQAPSCNVVLTDGPTLS